jgi:hypothetical protein
MPVHILFRSSSISLVSAYGVSGRLLTSVLVGFGLLGYIMGKA